MIAIPTEAPAPLGGSAGTRGAVATTTTAGVVATAPARILFTVFGTPAPQGSKRHVGHGVMIESSTKVKPWREAVKYAARTEIDAIPGFVTLDGPLVVRMIFTLRKPLSAPKTRRTWPDRTPDLDKLARATCDAIVQAGLIADDARIIEFLRLAKVYPGEDIDALDTPGARIEVRQATR